MKYLSLVLSAIALILAVFFFLSALSGCVHVKPARLHTLPPDGWGYSTPDVVNYDRG